MKRRFLQVLCLCFVCSTAAFSQQTTSSVDSLLAQTKTAYYQNDLTQLIEKAVPLATQSEKIGHEEGVVMGNYYIAHCYATFGEYQKSVAYLRKARKKQAYLQQNRLMAYLT